MTQKVIPKQYFMYVMFLIGGCVCVSRFFQRRLEFRLYSTAIAQLNFLGGLEQGG